MKAKLKKKLLLTFKNRGSCFI